MISIIDSIEGMDSINIEDISTDKFKYMIEHLGNINENVKKEGDMND